MKSKRWDTALDTELQGPTEPAWQRHGTYSRSKRSYDSGPVVGLDVYAKLVQLCPDHSSQRLHRCLLNDVPEGA